MDERGVQLRSLQSEERGKTARQRGDESEEIAEEAAMVAFQPDSFSRRLLPELGAFSESLGVEGADKRWNFMQTELKEKHDRLKEILSSYGDLLVAYSGGVDSSLLLRVAADVLGDRVMAVIADSPTFPASERKYAKAAARRIGVRHKIIRSGELSDGRFSSNPPERCYWCKRSLLARLKKIASAEGISKIAVGAQKDDLKDYRPGGRAVRECGAVSPLLEAGFSKGDVRKLSRRLGISGWRREAAACLASRIPYGEPIDGKKLRRIERAENIIVGKGFRGVRVRCHGDTARIEVEPSQIGRLSGKRLRAEITAKLKKLGFRFVCVDLEGYRTGSLNYGLKCKA